MDRSTVLRIDERNHAEKRLPERLAGRGWDIADLDHTDRVIAHELAHQHHSREAFMVKSVLRTTPDIDDGVLISMKEVATGLPRTSATGIRAHEETKHECHAGPDQGGAGSADE